MLALIGLQLVWLIDVYKYKNQELKDKTREAVLKTTERLQKEEDAEIILKNIDSLVVSDEIIGSPSKDIIRVIVSNIKNKLKTDTFKTNTKVKHEVRIIANDTSSSTTIIKIGNNKKNDTVILTETKQIEIKKRAGDLQALFMKMALNAGDVTAMSSPKINFAHIKELLKDELQKRGIDLEPKVSISDQFNLDTLKTFLGNYKSKGWRDTRLAENFIASLPLFPDNTFGAKLSLNVSYLSTTNFVIRQMMSLLGLSLFITILIGFVMIYIFRRMLSQEKLHQLKNDFINNMTHELKTPIATISLALEGINNPAIKNDEEKFNNYTAILKEENKKLNNHVERVLQMALLEKGELVLDKKAVNLKLLLENCITTHQLQIQNKKAKVILNAETEIIISGDEFHLLNAFTNLLDNALKYSGENCEITIFLNKQGEIIFKDNGIGIDPSLQTKIFEKFYRAQGGNLHDVKGFGLGLSYVKSIIEAHHGTIELKSDKNKGSEFIVKLKANEI